MCLTFTKILEKALKRQLAIDCLLIAEKREEEKKCCNNLVSYKKKGCLFMHVIKAIELNSPLERQGI